MDIVDLKELWEQLFGKLWRTVGAAGLYAGAFLLDDNGKQALCDRNAIEMLGLPSGDDMSADYASVRGVLDRLIELNNEDLPLSLNFLEDLNEGVTAGIVSLNERAFNQSYVNGLMLTQSELFKELGNEGCKRPLLLSKIQIMEGSKAEQESSLSSAIIAMQNVLPAGSFMAQHEYDEIWILLNEDCEDALETAKELRHSVENCKLYDIFGNVVGGHNFMTLMTGVCDQELLPTYKMHAATFALYQAMANGKAGEELFQSEHYAQGNTEYSEIVKFSKLLDQNLFSYHFQPIVSARTGEVVAYEALMRTGSELGLNPLEILDLATRYGRLYDIELATVRNTLAVLSENQSYFEERSLFINAIPSQLLTDEDFNEIKNSYGELLEKVVVEMTESTELDDDSLNHVIERVQSANMQVAIDDFGTGYSNTSNLLRYRPQVVKIDRSLITNIDSNPRMQKFVAGIIDFLHSSGMLALGEGVETIGEIRTLINMSVDLLQGFYVSRPKPVFVNSIAEEIKNQIVAINLEAAGLVKKIYHAADGDEVYMQDLALERFTDVHIAGGKVTLIGSGGNMTKIPVTISDGAKCTVILKGVSIEAPNDQPAITIGKNSIVSLYAEYGNLLEHSGIYVPESSKLTLKGVGMLTINPESHESYAIGNAPDAACGDITIDLDGHLLLNVNGENAVGIGAGHSGHIEILSGKTEIHCTNANCVGIGSWYSNCDIDINHCEVMVTFAAGTAVGIGSMFGDVDADCHDVAISCDGSGNKLCGIGTLESGKTSVRFRNMKLNVSMKGRNIICAGSYGTSSDFDISHASLNLYAEGGRVSGVGDMVGGGDITIDESELIVTFLSGENMPIGNSCGTLKIGNVLQKISLNE